MAGAGIGVREMSELTKKALVPVLRFPEFWDVGDWEEIKLIETVDKKIKWSFIGGPFGSNLKFSDYTPNGVRIIQLQNIGDAEFNEDYKVFTSNEKADELLSCNIYPGDIILSKMGDPVGRACLIPNNHNRYVMCSDGIRLVVDEKVHIKYFIYSLINSIQFRSLIEKTATGSTRKRIGLDDLKNLPVVVPNVREQQKIADCLSSIDELITAQTQKIEALKAHKKGLMQQLFPAEGETVPKLRFPEFLEAGDWISEELGNKTAKVGSGITPTGGDKNYKTIGRPFVRSQNIGWGVLILEDVAYIDELTHSTFLGTEIIEGDVLLNITGASIGRSAVADSRIKGGNVNQHVCIIRTKNTLIPFFLNQFLLSQNGQSQIDSFQAGGNRQGLNFAQIRSFSMPMPLKIEEQQKIANCLSSLDELITAQTQKLEALKAHKKGMMQKLFPSIDETTE
jgi:type I restriction enzyme S subunit